MARATRTPRYSPLQWVTQHEVDDLQAAVAYLRTRPDADPAGYGLFGVSRGGGTAICVARSIDAAWGVVTDGAFPTRGTMVAYIHRWAEIYVANPHIWKVMPHAVFEFLGWAGRVRTQLRLRCRYFQCRASCESAVTASLARDSWREGCVHRRRDCQEVLRASGRTERDVDRSRWPSTTAPAKKSHWPTPNDCSCSSTSSLPGRRNAPRFSRLPRWLPPNPSSCLPQLTSPRSLCRPSWKSLCRVEV